MQKPVARNKLCPLSKKNSKKQEKSASRQVRKCGPIFINSRGAWMGCFGCFGLVPQSPIPLRTHFFFLCQPKPHPTVFSKLCVLTNDALINNRPVFMFTKYSTLLTFVADMTVLCKSELHVLQFKELEKCLALYGLLFVFTERHEKGLCLFVCLLF